MIKLLIICFLLMFCMADKNQTLIQKKKDDKQKSVSEMKSPITVNGKTTVLKNCMFGEILSKGGIEVLSFNMKLVSLKTKKLEAKVLKTKLLKVGTLQAKHDGRPIVMNGSIAIYKMKTQEPKQKILLQEIQWDQLHHLDFNDQHPNSKCENLRDGHFLGGYCQDNNQTLTKRFQNIPVHNFLKIEFSLHVFDQWDKEQIVLYVDGIIQWKNKFENTIHHQNICGDSRYGDQINIPVMKMLEHNVSDLNITIQGITPKSTCDASFAIDNLVISFR